MNTKTYIILLCFFLSTSQLLSQSLERQVIANGGGFNTNSASISFTIGEPIIETTLLTDNHLTAGFQQGEFIGIALFTDVLKFEAFRIDRETVSLFWEVENDQNVKYYIIERSTNSSSEFTQIKTTESHQKTGLHTYEEVDDNDSFENTFYRLKIVDFQGAFKYSKIQVVPGTPLKNQVITYPNPTEGELMISIHPDDRIQLDLLNFSIVNEAGVQLFKQQMHYNPNGIQIDFFKNLEGGIYFLKIEFDKGFFEDIKVLKI